MNHVRTMIAIGVESPSRIVVSSIWWPAWTVWSPGGMLGASSRTTSSVAGTASAIEIHRTRRKCSRPVTLLPRFSYDLDEPVHVADGLHRPAEALDEPGSAWHVALPAVETRAGRGEAELDRLVVVAHRAGRVGARVLGAAGDAIEGHREVERLDREHVRGRGRVDRAGGLAIQQKLPAGDAGGLTEELVAQTGLGVELVDRHVHERVRGQVVGRGVLPRLQVRADRVV